MRKYFVCISVFYLALGTCWSQEYTFKGVIKDRETNEPLPGVSIIKKGTSEGTISDLGGYFSFITNDSIATFEFMYIGYLTEEVETSKESSYIEVLLIPDITKLEEVVVTGYGTSRESMITGSVSKMRIRGAASTISSTAPSSLASDYGSASQNNGLNAGTLTAGEINDFSKWTLWKDLSINELKEYKNRWNIHPDNRYTVQLNSTEGLPLIHATVQLYENEQLVWESKTDNTGKAELWAGSFKTKNEKSNKRLLVMYKGQTIEQKKVKPFRKGINIIEVDAPYSIPKDVDIAFIVDATGSMGDEINYLKTELDDIISRATDSLTNRTINLASVFYRDTHDDYLTRQSDFSQNIKNTTSFIQNQNANGGGDFPEAVHSGLEEAIENLSWSKEALAKIAFLVLDAPPHQNKKVNASIESSIRKASKQGIRLIPVTCSGIDKSTEYLMRSMSLLTNGTYVFLTDDSGVGNPHIKPSTDEYTVELLNDLIFRLIIQYTRVPDPATIASGIMADTLSIQALIENVEMDTTTNEVNPKNNTTDVNSSDEKIKLKCYPNPNHGVVNIESNRGIKEIFLCDLSGKILQRETFNNAHNMIIDISGFPIGTYIIRYEYDTNKWLTGKIVLVR